MEHPIAEAARVDGSSVMGSVWVHRDGRTGRTDVLPAVMPEPLPAEQGDADRVAVVRMPVVAMTTEPCLQQLDPGSGMPPEPKEDGGGPGTVAAPPRVTTC